MCGMNSDLIFKRLSPVELGYFIGVGQSDGYLKKPKNSSYYLGIGVRKKSLPMFNKFRNLCKRLTNNSGSTYIDKRYNNKSYQFNVGCGHLVPTFEELNLVFNESCPPKWLVKNKIIFGAYLAGLIDGDGDVRITRQKYPQCSVRISLNRKIPELTNAIKNSLRVSVSKSPTNSLVKLTLKTK